MNKSNAKSLLSEVTSYLSRLRRESVTAASKAAPRMSISWKQLLVAMAECERELLSAVSVEPALPVVDAIEGRTDRVWVLLGKGVSASVPR